MNLQHDWFWATHHIIKIIEILGDVIACDAVVKSVAEKYGFTKLASLCDIIAKWINFILDIIIGLMQALKKQPPTGGTT